MCVYLGPVSTLALPLAFDPIGIGDTWTGVVLGVLAVFIFITAFLAWPWGWWLRLTGKINADELHYGLYRRPVTRGTVLCDWVDLTVLTSIAKQKAVDPEPVRTERGEGTTTSGAIDAKPKGIGGRFSRERRQDVKEYYEIPQDPNALLVKVLGKLSEDGRLADDLDEAWGTAALTGDTLDEMIRTAKQTPELEAAREAILTLQGNAAKERVLEGWRHTAQEPKFALVESTWRVHEVDLLGGPPEMWLSLNKLRQREYNPDPYHGNRPETPTLIDVPDGMALVVRFDASKLTDQGKGRVVDGSRELRAGVFGITSNFDEEHGNLWMTPIAIFARIES
jgi:hypothetical protein